MVYVVYIHFYTVYVFISNAIKMQETLIHSFWYRSFQNNCGSLATQTLIGPDLALPVIISALSYIVRMVQ